MAGDWFPRHRNFYPLADQFLAFVYPLFYRGSADRGSFPFRTHAFDTVVHGRGRYGRRQESGGFDLVPGTADQTRTFGVLYP